MKQESDVRPTKSYEIEDIKGNSCEVVFFDLQNIEEIQREDEEGKITTIYKYSLFRLKCGYFDELSNEINKNYAEWFNRAKNADYDKMAAMVRAKRNQLLADSDNSMCIDRLGFDIPQVITATTLLTVVKNVFSVLREMKTGRMAIYRQQLRDITKQEGFPYDVVFPVKPEE